MKNIMALDLEVKNGLNSLTDEEISREVSYAYEHEILWYGIDALIHNIVMHEAMDVALGQFNIDKFIEKYEVDFNLNKNIGSTFKIEFDELNGIFIPIQKYHGRKRITKNLFNRDYINTFLTYLINHNCNEYTYVEEIIGKVWNKEDLLDHKVITEGLKFSKDMWDKCIKSYNGLKAGGSFSIPKQPEKVTKLADELVKHYGEIIHAE